MSNVQRDKQPRSRSTRRWQHADLTNGERTAQDEPETAQRASGSDPEALSADPEAPGTYVSDGEASSVAEPNEPA